MKRIFTFGCSFTSFRWPTWADILINHFENNGLIGVNLGKHAASNQYAFIKFMEMVREVPTQKNSLKNLLGRNNFIAFS